MSIPDAKPADPFLPPDPQAPPPDPKVASLIEDMRQKLVETSTRNRLIHVNRQGRGKFINIINERSDDIFRILYVEGKRMRFHPCESEPATAERDEGANDVVFEEVDMGHFQGVSEVDPARYTDHLLDTPFGVDALQKRLLQLARDAKTAEEEQGVNILFLVLGFLQWYEVEHSEKMREAPLVLLPVDLVRNMRTSTYDLRARPEDLTTNLSLQARLRDDFGLYLPDIDTKEDWKPSDYFKQVREAVRVRSRWHVDENGMQIGFYSFAKQLLQRDLEQNPWPEGRLAGDPTIAALMVHGFEDQSPMFGESERLDKKLAPEDIVHVINADASQTKVIEEVRSGRNLVVHGPPGTGKSQTIANIIAAAAHDGKTVLFMAEKMAALEVVHDRMKKCGLSDLCLEIHSRHANKREVLKSIGATLRKASAKDPGLLKADALRVSQDHLNRIDDLLHGRVPDRDFTPFDAMAAIVDCMGAGQRPPELPTGGLAEWTSERRTEIEREIAKLAELLQGVGARCEHPFFGVEALDIGPVELEQLRDKLECALDALRVASQADRVLFESLLASEPGDLIPGDSLQQLEISAGFIDLLNRPPQDSDHILPDLFEKSDLNTLMQALDAGLLWSSARQKAASMFREHAFDVPAPPLQADLERGAGSFLARLGGRYRTASRTLAGLLSGPLPKIARERASLAGQIAEVQRLRRTLSQEEGFLASSLDALWRGERTDFAGLRDAARWARDVKATSRAASMEDIARMQAPFPDLGGAASTIRGKAAAALDAIRSVLDGLRLDLGADVQDVSLEALRKRFAAMSDDMGRYDEWRSMERLRETLREAGIEALVEMLDDERLTPADALGEFRYASAMACWEHAQEALPALSELVDLDRHELVKNFSRLVGSREERVRAFLRARHFAQLPKGGVGEMGVILGEIAKSKKHKPIRWLMDKAGGMIQRIKPVFMMSPISIAQYLPPGALRFNLLVVDEASQVRPEDAIGAMARCGQLVIVGDQKQLPPTSFFDRLGANEAPDEDDEEMDAALATEMESVLTLCEARGMGGRMLEWHYRSRDPSLIRISNDEFYDSRLILPPSPLDPDDPCGLAFVRVPGVYASQGSDLGRPGTNRIEAGRIVSAVAEHARQDPRLSLGIVTFSKAQCDMVTEILELERRKDEVLNDFLVEGKREDVFVKNIENVQGDERDVIFVGVGYGPREPNGRLTSMRFGPINAEGGERRLNVLFTRARTRCRVFASFDPGDIDLSRAKGEGPRVLKCFLEYARSGQVIEHLRTGQGADSPFEEDVGRCIRSFGYPVDYQVGSGGFRIDLGVRHPDAPGRYILAVECDGATYHSALSARERDRHRQAVLEGMGWTFHRIWSTDWFYRRSRERKRLREALDQVRKESRRRIGGAGANDTAEREQDGSIEVSVPEHQPSNLPGKSGLSVPLYCAASREDVLKAVSDLDLKNMPRRHRDAALRKAIARRIVEIEGPLHRDLVARCLAGAMGKNAGKQFVEMADHALELAAQQADRGILQQGDFWLTREQAEAPPVRDRSKASTHVKSAQFLPPMEIRAAAWLIEQESGRVERDDLVREVSRLFGFKKTGAKLKQAIGAALGDQ